MNGPPVVLSIAGTDSGGAAGLAADLTTFAALGAHGTCAVTAVTAQDTTGVHAIVPLAAADVRAQIVAVFDDLPVAAAKAGMLGSAEVAHIVADLVAVSVPLVVDPVLVATSGAVLGDDLLVTAYRDVLLPRCAVVTPNLHEAVRLTGLDPERPLPEIARALHEIAPAVVLTGGDPCARVCRDVVIDRLGHLAVLEHPAVPSSNDHGTGCTFSAALAVHLARGLDLGPAVRLAQSFVARALATSATWQLGRGRGPVAHVFTHPHKEN
ncbi:bifunctional hydroxymethylpyrimidine kinase/phosphomethylpyrimidine kinase [Aeromicrobium sp.]|uniref:bifunctional hydroxymethylpyrimidine kinase/phosphomethylpyrimidine kinase n=1 Tax=Aeromicrobium sp. TaxID=1871063 RepID=UPI0019A5EABD|nr:bifunctional hydroxymethylpyrimidine kinase/phosphomethylpyrimidine kinase [Aeromicrobium sp.]MBC7631512.1 bifunctional hydroxymethylpyrimidine kinase/phosphomethylpyrimidine kinase [Aeromicrobium sp.]